MPNLFEDGNRRPGVCLTERGSFEDAGAGISIAGMGRCIDDDVRVDEEQLSEAPFDELVELVGSDKASAPSDYRSIGPPPVFLGDDREMRVDRLSDQRGDRDTAALGLLLKVAPLLRSQKYLESLAEHTHSIHIKAALTCRTDATGRSRSSIWSSRSSNNVARVGPAVGLNGCYSNPGSDLSELL